MENLLRRGEEREDHGGSVWAVRLAESTEVRVGTEEVDSSRRLVASYGGSGRAEPNRLHREKKARVEEGNRGERRAKRGVR